MRLLDLFCGGGGASMGYYYAGFTDIVGVDINPQSNYPFEFVQADARKLSQSLEAFDLIHASPPCQYYTAGAKRWRTTGNHVNMIDEVREILQESGTPYVIENVPGARALLNNPVMLCGTQFDLGVFRHRYFETSIEVPELAHSKHHGRIGDGKYYTVTGHSGGSSKRDGWVGGSVDDWRSAMGIDWMIGKELAQSIPPAYTQYLGTHLLRSGLTAV